MDHWREIERAPLEKPIEVMVEDGRGSYSLTFACRLTIKGWFNHFANVPIEVDPVAWRYAPNHLLQPSRPMDRLYNPDGSRSWRSISRDLQCLPGKSYDSCPACHHRGFRQVRLNFLKEPVIKCFQCQQEWIDRMGAYTPHSNRRRTYVFRSTY